MFVFCGKGEEEKREGEGKGKGKGKGKGGRRAENRLRWRLGVLRRGERREVRENRVSFLGRGY